MPNDKVDSFEVGPPTRHGDEAGDTRLHLAAMTRVYRRSRAQGGGNRLDHAEITRLEIFDGGFPALAECVLGDLRYPYATADKLETYAWVPATYRASEQYRKGPAGPALERGFWRSGEDEAPRLCLMYADVDNKDDARPHMTEEGVRDGLAALCEGPVRFFTYTTWSSQPGRRKFRIVYDTSRWLTRWEMRRCHVALDELVYGRQGDGSIYDPGDMVYGPPRLTEATWHDGAPLDVDRLLDLEAALREAEPEAIAARYDPRPRAAAVARPFAPLTPEEEAAVRERIADASLRSGFAGIDDPSVFNPGWREEFAQTAVQGSHYATMLSLLGRTWRKTGGTLTFGEMLAVHDGIDATDAFYMRSKYGPEKAREMVGFVMSRPVAGFEPPPLDPGRLRPVFRRWRERRGA